MSIRSCVTALLLAGMAIACSDDVGVVPGGASDPAADQDTATSGDDLPQTAIPLTPLEPTVTVISESPSGCDYEGFEYDLTLETPAPTPVRDAPSLSASQIGTLDEGSVVQAFFDTRMVVDQISWTAAWAGQEIGCGWVAIHGEPTDESPCPGSSRLGAVSGVADWVNVRVGPGLSSEVVERADADAGLRYFPETIAEADQLFWVGVDNVVPGACSYVATIHVKQADGRAMHVDARSYLTRALFGLDPETMHATQELTGPEEMGPFSDDVLRPGLQQLARIGAEYPDVSVVPVPVEGATWEPPGCYFSHGSACTYRLLAGGAEIAVVDIRIYGDGITGLFVEEN